MIDTTQYDYLSHRDTPGKVAEALKERIRLRRKEWHYSQAELAKKSGVSFGSIKRFERFNEISLSSLLKIAMTLDCLSDFAALFSQPHYETIEGPFPGFDDVSKGSDALSFSTIKTMVLSILAQRPHVFKKVYLVGSYAKGSADKKSDIDLLVYPSKIATIGDLGYLQYRLAQVSKKDVDVIDGSSASQPFLASASQGQILLYEN